AGAKYQYIPLVSNPAGRPLTYDITSKPEWATFVPSSGELFGTPGNSDVGTSTEIEIGVSDGTTRAIIGPFRITVNPPATPPPVTPPTIAGTPAATVTAGQPYSFQPMVTNPGRSTLSFTIVNRPAWGTFSTATGALSGTPTTTNEGTFANIVITASDGTLTASLPAFSIQVLAPANDTPTISGIPPTSVVAGSNYSFQPSATDPAGKVLTFSIQAMPPWATFSASTGALTGT